MFLACASQWRHGYSGVTGLDYNVVIALFSVYRIKKKHQETILDEVRALELGALNVFEERRKAKTD